MSHQQVQYSRFENVENQAPPDYAVQQQQQGLVTVAINGSYEKWNWCHFVTSVLASFCCQPFGLVALVMSLLAYTDHKTKDFARSHNKRRVALGFAIAAIVIGSLLMILMFAQIIAVLTRDDSPINNTHNKYD